MSPTLYDDLDLVFLLASYHHLVFCLLYRKYPVLCLIAFNSSNQQTGPVDT